jgi:hypothetical protein
MHTEFQLENLQGRNHLRDLGTDGQKILLNWILKEKQSEDVEWIHMAQNRVQWQVLANTVMNLSVP